MFALLLTPGVVLGVAVFGGEGLGIEGVGREDETLEEAADRRGRVEVVGFPRLEFHGGLDGVAFLDADAVAGVLGLDAEVSFDLVVVVLQLFGLEVVEGIWSWSGVCGGGRLGGRGEGGSSLGKDPGIVLELALVALLSFILLPCN